jgi:hypothetical protein
MGGSVIGLGKECLSCGTFRTWDMFRKDSRTRTGYRASCKYCASVKLKEDSVQNAEASKRYYLKHRDKVLKKKAEDRRRRPEVYKVFDAMKKAKRRSAYVRWASPEGVQAVYDLAKHMTETTGEVHHVDHVIPIKGKKVTGLHVEGNLRVVTAKENLAKHNKYEGCE